MFEVPRTRIVGIDLGKLRDPTAIAILERGYVPNGTLYNDDYYNGWREPVKTEYHVRHLERPELGTDYTVVLERILSLLESLVGVGEEVIIAVDITGVGESVKDFLNARLNEWVESASLVTKKKMQLGAVWIMITGADSVSKVEGSRGVIRVPKRDLASAPLVLMQQGRLKIAESLELARVLKAELLNFKVKINIATGHDSYEAWREGDHDDLVLAVAMACWSGERYLIKRTSLPRPSLIV
jgi:hypothetical protein